MHKLEPGLSAEYLDIVKETNTAAHWGSGGIEVFATPALVALMESASYLAVSETLPKGQTTVGGQINVRHLAATPVGMKVRARAELTAVEGHKLTFNVTAWDEKEVIGQAEHIRFIIDEAKFMAKVQSKGHAPATKKGE